MQTEEFRNAPHSPDVAHALIEQRLNEHTDVIRNLLESDRSQDERLAKIEKNTETLIEIFQAAEGTVKTLKWLGKVAGWVAGIASAIYAVLYTLANWPHKGS